MMRQRDEAGKRVAGERSNLMTMIAISHIAIGVRDMEISLGFYRDVLGLQISADRIEEFPQGPDEAWARRRAVFLRWSDDPLSTYLLLDQQLTKQTQGSAHELYTAGFHHFGFWVEELGPIMDRARAAGIRVTVTNEDGPGVDGEWYGEAAGLATINYVIMRDPEGNYVQIDQRLPASDA
jgi:catechol 2,3-dioxygenase-like lactoylglutathione lyase family enzyme